MASNASHNRDKARSQDLTLFVQDMVDQMNTKFTKIGESIMGRMNEMNARMDELEQSIGDLMNQAGLEPVITNSSSSDGDTRDVSPKSATTSKSAKNRLQK